MPAFTREQFMQAAFQFVVKPLRQAPPLTKIKSVGSTASDKETQKAIQLAEKQEILTRDQESRYLSYLNDPGAIVAWKDVIEVVYTLPTDLTSK